MTYWIHTDEDTKFINVRDFTDPNQVIGKTIPVNMARYAPDLLEVAKMVKQWSNGLRHETAYECMMIRAAKAAIAKAEGTESCS